MDTISRFSFSYTGVSDTLQKNSSGSGLSFNPQYVNNVGVVSLNIASVGARSTRTLTLTNHTLKS